MVCISIYLGSGNLFPLCCCVQFSIPFLFYNLQLICVIGNSNFPLAEQIMNYLLGRQVDSNYMVRVYCMRGLSKLDPLLLASWLDNSNLWLFSRYASFLRLSSVLGFMRAFSITHSLVFLRSHISTVRTNPLVK